MKNLKKMREEYGAGEWGTPELTKKFKSETPGQDVLDEAKGPETYTAAAGELSAHAMKAKSALAHRKAADAHTEASASHSRKVDKLVKSGASQDQVSQHEAQVKMHDQNAQRHRLHSLRFHALGMKESIGTVSESSVEDHETSMAFHHEKAQAAKAKGDNQAYERHLNIKHQHAIERDKLNASKQKHASAINLSKQKNESETLGEDAVSSASSAAHALSLAARNKKSHLAAAVAHKSAAGKLQQKRADSAEDRTMSGDQHKTAKHVIDRHLRRASEHEKLASSMKEGWEMPLPIEPESGVIHHEQADEDDGDNEGQMAKWQLQDIAEMAQSLADNLDDDDELEAWVQEHITSAHNALDNVYAYAESEEMDLDLGSPEITEATEKGSSETESDPNSPEEKKERMRLETLIRLGLLDRALLPVIRRSMKKLESGQNINATVERAALFDLLQQLVGIVTGDDTIFRKVRLDVSQNKQF